MREDPLAALIVKRQQLAYQMADVEADITRLLGTRRDPPAAPAIETAESYVTIKDLAQKLGYAPKTIMNLMSAGTFIRDVHYVKPHQGRVLFRWSAIETWLTTQAPR